jgi:hypothetical protein
MTCEDCKGTGKIVTEGVVPGRPYFDKLEGQIVRDYHGDGKWQETQCHCVGEYDD